jgi:E3 ubiquitin-protein ligase MARCH6
MAEIAERAVAGELPEEPRPPHGEEEDEEEEEEGDVCRICRNRGDEDHPLRYPCACSGSIKFVHQDCLLQWLDHSNSRQCEVKPPPPPPSPRGWGRRWVVALGID